MICKLLTESRQARCYWQPPGYTDISATTTQPSGQTTQLGRFVARNFEVVDKCDRSQRMKITPPWLASLRFVGICYQRSSGPKAACQRSKGDSSRKLSAVSPILYPPPGHTAGSLRLGRSFSGCEGYTLRVFFLRNFGNFISALLGRGGLQVLF